MMGPGAQAKSEVPWVRLGDTVIRSEGAWVIIRGGAEEVAKAVVERVVEDADVEQNIRDADRTQKRLLAKGWEDAFAHGLAKSAVISVGGTQGVQKSKEGQKQRSAAKESKAQVRGESSQPRPRLRRVSFGSRILRDSFLVAEVDNRQGS